MFLYIVVFYWPNLCLVSPRVSYNAVIRSRWLAVSQHCISTTERQPLESLRMSNVAGTSTISIHVDASPCELLLQSCNVPEPIQVVQNAPRSWQSSLLLVGSWRWSTDCHWTYSNVLWGSSQIWSNGGSFTISWLVYMTPTYENFKIKKRSQPTKEVYEDVQCDVWDDHPSILAD